MIVGVSRHPTAVDIDSVTARMVQNSVIESRSSRVTPMNTQQDRSPPSRRAEQHGRDTALTSIGRVKLPNQSAAVHLSGGSINSMRESDANPLTSVAMSVSSVTSCAPTPTLSPNGSPKLTRKNSFHSLRRPSTASSHSGSDCPHCLEDATVRSTIGNSDDEDDSSSGDDSQQITIKANQSATTQRPATGNQSVAVVIKVDSSPQEDDSRLVQIGEKPKVASVRRTQSLTTGSRRKVVSMPMPSNFMLPPTLQQQEQPAKQRVEAAGNLGVSRTVVDSTPNANGTVAASKTKRKAVPAVSSVAAFMNQKVLVSNGSTPPSLPNFFNEDTIRSLASGAKPPGMFDDRKASSNERLATGAVANVAQPQPMSDKMLLPDKNLFRKSQWSSESTLNTLPQNGPAAQTTTAPKALPQPFAITSHSKRPVRQSANEEGEAVHEENHNVVNGTASGPSPVKVYHAKKPLRNDKPVGNADRGAPAVVSRSRTKQRQPIATPLQYQPSENSTLRSSVSTFDDTDIDIGWDELSGVASDHSSTCTSLVVKTHGVSRSTQSTQHEMNGLLESYETHLGELDVITQRERQTFEQLRAKAITAEYWRDTAKMLLKLKLATVRQMGKLLE